MLLVEEAGQEEVGGGGQKEGRGRVKTRRRWRREGRSKGGGVN